MIVKHDLVYAVQWNFYNQFRIVVVDGEELN